MPGLLLLCAHIRPCKQTQKILTKRVCRSLQSQQRVCRPPCVFLQCLPEPPMLSLLCVPSTSAAQRPYNAHQTGFNKLRWGLIC